MKKYSHIAQELKTSQGLSKFSTLAVKDLDFVYPWDIV
jgi:hypothetical protein